MPRIYGTRKQKAVQLLERLKKGPASLDGRGEKLSIFAYKLWSEKWVIPQLIELVPELKKLQKEEQP